MEAAGRSGGGGKGRNFRPLPREAIPDRHFGLPPPRGPGPGGVQANGYADGRVGGQARPRVDQGCRGAVRHLSWAVVSDPPKRSSTGMGLDVKDIEIRFSPVYAWLLIGFG